MGFQTIPGTKDVLPDDLARWQRVERAARRISRLYGYGEIRTPLIEDAALFLRSVGETSDIVQKEMFRFKDRGDHDLALRPEGTASVVRAYLEHNLHKTHGFAKLFYAGPMFRAERPQAGRFRQFHQFGVEAIGSSSPWVDVETLTLCLQILRECGVHDGALWIGSMGSREDQERSAQTLRKRLAPRRMQLCQECQARFDKNVFRVLDCKNPQCHAIAQEALGPSASPFVLSAESQTRFDEVRNGLRSSGIPFDDTQPFARGLDYYTHTVFEVRAKGLGAQDAVAAGGRYDHLVEDLGGPPLGAVGFAAGIERVLLAAAGSPGEAPPPPDRGGVYVAVAQPALAPHGFQLVQHLRGRGVQAIMGYEGKSLKAQLREADQAACRFAAILGEQELAQHSITVKELGPRSDNPMPGGNQRTIPLDTFLEDMRHSAKHACHPTR